MALALRPEVDVMRRPRPLISSLSPKWWDRPARRGGPRGGVFARPVGPARHTHANARPEHRRRADPLGYSERGPDGESTQVAVAASDTPLPPTVETATPIVLPTPALSTPEHTPKDEGAPLLPTETQTPTASSSLRTRPQRFCRPFPHGRPVRHRRPRRPARAGASPAPTRRLNSDSHPDRHAHTNTNSNPNSDPHSDPAARPRLHFRPHGERPRYFPARPEPRQPRARFRARRRQQHGQPRLLRAVRLRQLQPRRIRLSARRAQPTSGDRSGATALRRWAVSAPPKCLTRLSTIPPAASRANRRSRASIACSVPHRPHPAGHGRPSNLAGVSGSLSADRGVHHRQGDYTGAHHESG